MRKTEFKVEKTEFFLYILYIFSGFVLYYCHVLYIICLSHQSCPFKEDV